MLPPPVRKFPIYFRWAAPLFVSVSVASCLSAASPQRTKSQDPVEKPNPIPDTLPAPPFDPTTPPVLLHRDAWGAVAVSKWRLGNGLEVILARDPKAHSISYMTWYRVGSRDENAGAGQTGLAHLFEHLMFTQTKSDPEPGTFDRRMEEVGGDINAMTFYDYTAYINNLPADRLPLAARMEADRMVNLALTQDQVETEREVVAEERRAVVDDDVDGTLDELIYKNAFQRHPYRWPIIGWMKDIESITHKSAIAFYKRHYAPNNAFLVIAGRFAEDAALQTVVDAYGLLPPAPLPRPVVPDERGPVANKTITITRPVPADRLAVAFASPGLGDADRPVLEVLDEILTGGPSSVLYKRLVVEMEIASSVQSGAADTKDPSLFTVWVQMRKGHKASEAQKVMDDVIAKLARNQVSEIDLTKARNRLEMDFWSSLRSSEGKAEQLGLFEVATGDHRNLLRRAGAYASIDAAAISRVAQTYLLDRPRIVAVAIPEDENEP